MTYKGETFEVDFKKVPDTRRIETSCTCRQQLTVPLCLHKIVSLLRIEKEMGPGAFDLMRDFTTEKTKLLAEYGYTLADDIQGKFDFKVTQREVQLIKLDATIQKIKGYQNWETLKSAILSPKRTNFVVSSKTSAGSDESRIPVFVFWPLSSNALTDFGFGVFSARYNDKSQKLVNIKSYSGSRQYYYGPEEILPMSEAEGRICQLAKNWDERLQWRCCGCIHSYCYASIGLLN